MIFQKSLKNLRKFNDFGSSSRPKIAPRWPQARSRWPKIGPRRLQDDLEERFFRSQKTTSILRRFGFVLGPILAPFAPPNAVLLAPFWRSKSIKKSIRNRAAQKVAPRSPRDRPRPSQDVPQTPSGPLKTPSRTPQDAPRSPRTPPGPPKMPPGPPPDAPRCPPGPLRTTQNAFPKLLTP